MTPQTHSTTSDHLIDLYASRMRARYQRPPGPLQPRRNTSDIHRFGRQETKRTSNASRSRRALATVMATAVFATATPSIASASAYEVKPGDTLSEIADRYGTTIEDLVRINSLANPDRIYAGDQLKLIEKEIEHPQVGDTVYMVRTGDTLFEIAQSHGVSLAAILSLNEIENPDLIRVGETLIIPTSKIDSLAVESSTTDASTPSPEDHVASLHLIGRGETLSGIALRYNVAIDALAAINQIEDINRIMSGTLLKIPSATYNPQPTGVTSQATQIEQHGTILQGVPGIQQSLSLSCESAAASMVTAFWGHQVSEWVFIENMPYHPNPHRGFRGRMDGPFGGTDNYGVYAKPMASILANYGFASEEFYGQGDPTRLKQWIDSGVPVMIWMTNMASVQERSYEWYQGERFALVPQQHAVVAYGYDDTGVYVADPGDGQHRVFAWDDFLRSWSYFDGMSLAVYPKV